MTQHAQQPPDTATYVFAVCGALAPDALEGLEGLCAGAPVRVLPLGSLAAVVQSVPARDYTDEAWQARLADPRDIERCARSHHEAVSAAAARGPTIPLPLATLYLSDARARETLDDEASRFHAALRRVAHHAEWGVKVYAPPSSPAGAADGAQPSPPAPAARPAAGAGLAYLERKRGLQLRREQHHEQVLRIAEDVDAELCLLATAARRLRPHAHRPQDGQGSQVLNATYLVPDDRAHELAGLARALRRRTGARIEVSGPWVPYSFVSEV